MGRSPPARSVQATRSEAEAELLDFVKRNWDAEVGTKMPEDPDEMIREYFADVLEACTRLAKGDRPADRKGDEPERSTVV